MEGSGISVGPQQDDASVARATVVHAFAQNPRLTWTAAHLASWYGFRISLVKAALRDLLHRGLIRRPQTGRGDLYQWVDSRAVRSIRRPLEGGLRPRVVERSASVPRVGSADVIRPLSGTGVRS